MAGRYSGVVEPYDDLVQVASLGLLNAIDRYDLDRETPFVGFAKQTIMGELKRYFRDKVWTIRVPRVLHDRMAAIETVSEELSRPPTPAEIAARTDLEVDQIFETLRRQGRKLPEEFDATDIALVGVASHKLSRLISKDKQVPVTPAKARRAKVTSPLRAPFIELKGSGSRNVSASGRRRGPSPQLLCRRPGGSPRRSGPRTRRR